MTNISWQNDDLPKENLEMSVKTHSLNMKDFNNVVEDQYERCEH